MSQFANQLLKSMEDEDFTQTYMADKVGVSQGQMSRYLSAENRPEPDAFQKICALFPERQRVALLLAYLLDDVPKKYRHLITISPAVNNSRTREDPTVYRSRMPRKLRTAYDFLGEAALEKPTVAESLISTYELLKGAA